MTHPTSAPPHHTPSASHPRGTRRHAGRGALGVLVVVVAVVVAACGSTPTRDDALAATVDEVAVPAHEAFAADTADLADEVSVWCDGGDVEGSAPDSLAEAFRTAVGSRHHQLAASGGPTTERTSMSLVDWPVDPEAVAELATGDDEPTVERLRTGASSRRGLYAIELLAFGDDSETVPADLDPARRCDYLIAATSLVAEEADRLVAAWVDGVDGAGPYRDRLVGEGGVTLLGDSAVEDVVREQVFLADELVDGLVADARGQDAAMGPREGLAGAGPAIVGGALDGLEAAYAPERLGSQLSEPQADALATAIARARSSVTDTDSDTGLRDLGDDQLAEVQDALEGVRVALRTDVVSALDITVGFSDNDGDSG